MSATHTQGPWANGHYDDIDDEIVIQTHDGEYVASIDCDGAYQGNIAATIEANARLIAAAPDLLEALRGLVAEHLPDAEANFEYLSREGNHAQLEQEECDLRKWQAARAAIAKATGEPK